MFGYELIEESTATRQPGRPSIWLLSLVVGATMMTGCSEPVEEETIIRPVRVVRVAAPQDISGRALPGRARATEETNLSFGVPGTVLERPVDVGDEVKAGQMLSRLDQRDYKNEHDAAIATRNRMRANFERVKIAAESGAVSRQDLDDARAQLDVAQAQVNITGKAIQDSEIVAPRDGTISATYVEAFMNVQAKEPIVRLLDTSAIEMVVQVPESLISLASRVAEINVEFDAFPGRSVSAEIKEISNEASQTTRTFPVTLIMEQPEDFKILPGMAGRAVGRLEEGSMDRQTGFQIPVSAIFTPDEAGAEGSSWVWVVDESTNTVSRRQVTIGELGRFGISVFEGIETGDMVVTAGANFLKEGQEVRPHLNGGST
jgi:RND family efflux transporter MFP subunit